MYAIDPASQVITSLPFNDFLSIASFASGDFKLDGFEEIVLASRSGVRLVTAVDRENLSNGLYAGPQSNFSAYSLSKPAVGGDFDGDGYPEVAVAYDEGSQRHWRLNIYHVDAQTLALDLKHSEVFYSYGLNPTLTVSLAAGRFGSTVHDQLLLAYDVPFTGQSFKSSTLTAP